MERWSICSDNIEAFLVHAPMNQSISIKREGTHVAEGLECDMANCMHYECARVVILIKVDGNINSDRCWSTWFSDCSQKCCTIKTSLMISTRSSTSPFFFCKLSSPQVIAMSKKALVSQGLQWTILKGVSLHNELQCFPCCIRSMFCIEYKDLATIYGKWFVTCTTFPESNWVWGLIVIDTPYGVRVW